MHLILTWFGVETGYTLEEVKQDILIAVSKVNHKVFKVPIRRGDDLYKSGKKNITISLLNGGYCFEKRTDFKINKTKINYEN